MKHKKQSWYKADDVRLNSLFSFDYCFCGSDCKNIKCGRNQYSKSYAAMLRSNYNGIHSVSDFSGKCDDYQNV